MKKETFERSLRAFAQRQPFKPFRVELASGTKLIIEHPVALARRGPAAVYIDPDGNYTLFDNTSVVKLTDSTGNGTRRSPRPT